MKRLMIAVLVLGLFATSCGSDAEDAVSDDLATTSGVAPATGTCLAGDPDCADGADGGEAPPLPSVVTLGDPLDPDTPLQISYGGFFFSDGTTSQLCSALAESFPPQCASPVVELAASLETVLEHVAESFGNPEDAKINIDQGTYWTDDWVLLSGVLEGNRLLLE